VICIHTRVIDYAEMFIFLLHLNRSFFASSSYLLQCNLYINCLHSGYEEIRDRKLLEILKKDRKWLKYELHCNVKTPEEIQALCMVFTLGEIWTLKLMGFFFQKHLMFCNLWSTFFGLQNARFQKLPPPGPLTALSLIF
jgi:hypothetical protein